ncbi:MAG: DNA topoisomerase 3 [Bacteroidaceae bacterium]|nr:DNA topoisomerase 3 [Bacteroidaceae bacterium]
MIVCIAEKPSVARDIAQVLGASDRKDGYIEGNGYQVTWTFGHLCTLKEPQDYTDAWKSWSLGALPMVPPRFGIKLISNDTYEKQFHIIEGLMQKAEMIINCGDAGQEGELIQRWVMQKARAQCPVKRLWISSLTEESIREGFNHLHDAADYQSLYEAGLSRAIGDWLLGMNATRLYTIKYGQNRQVLSIGRVQTPTLALIVNRQQEIENFVPRQYWELKTNYRDTLFNAVVKKSDEELIAEAEKNKKGDKEEIDISTIDNPGMEPIANETEGLALVGRIKDLPFEVIGVTKKQGKEFPPRLYDLTSLQVDCNKKYGFSADDTLKLIQSLYEKKVTTYPRVDTTFLSDDIYPKCPNILKGLRGYENLIEPLVGKSVNGKWSVANPKLPKSKKVFDNSKVTDHHAIIPTGQPPVSLTDQEKKVFDMVARHFIAVFYPECKISTTTVEGKVKDILFKTSGRQVLDPGWRVVFERVENGKLVNDNDDQDVPNEQPNPFGTISSFVKGEQGPHIPELQEKWTQPPRPYTEATLLRAMETAGKLVDNDELRDALKENGIGRPSTRAAIIETLFKRNYIRKERKNLVATPTGIELIGLIHEDLLKSAELTGLWEKKLREIEKKTYQAGQFLGELKQMVSEIVNAVLSDNSNRRITVLNPVDEKKKKKANKQSATKAGKGTGKIRRSPSTVTASGDHTSTSKVSNDQLEANDSIIGKPCPVCGKGHIIKGNTAYGCSDWKSGCTFRLPFQVKK